MQLSLNEAETMVRKAFRGAGYHWGEAEDAGKAAIWLARRGLPAIEPVLAVLNSAQGDPARLRPVISGAAWRGGAGTLCPVLAGIALADGAVALTPGPTARFERLLSPVLLLPFVAAAAEASGSTLTLDWSEGMAVVQPRGVIVDGDGLIPADVTLHVVRGDGPDAPVLAASARTLQVEPAHWQALNRYAVETYVPATDHSRIAGAGAGLADND